MELQQYLPFTVLKQHAVKDVTCFEMELQQYLPFTVLKLEQKISFMVNGEVATVLTVYGIETSTNWIVVEKAKVATVLTVYGIETL